MKFKQRLGLLLLLAAFLLISPCFAKSNRGHEQKNRYHEGYKHDRSGFVYQGTYDEYDDIFIFSDREGNEFDLYIAPLHRSPRWFRGYPVRIGDDYDIRITQTKMYPRPDEQSAGISLTFKWGNLTMEDGRYYLIYTSSDLVNIRGRLYVKE